MTSIFLINKIKRFKRYRKSYFSGDSYPVINKQISKHEKLAEAKDILLRFDCTDQAFVVADRNMVATILRNLISNAIKFTDPGGRVVVAEKTGDDDVEVSVCDNGQGMPDQSDEPLTAVTLFEEELPPRVPVVMGEMGYTFFTSITNNSATLKES